MPNQIRDISVIDKDTYPYIFEQNVTVKLRSNTGLVRLNVYRPKKSEGVPVIITYGPYGKDTPYEDFLAHSFHDGYAVVRADEVGIGQSPGVADTMSKSTTDAFFKVIEWAADQPWSNGKVSLLGISYFGGSQWRVVARRPRGLAYIIPCRHGGILTAPFLKFWFNRQVKSNQYGLANRSKNQRGLDTIKGDLSKEELKGNCRDQLINNSNNFFRDDEYYASRDYNLEDIEVPLLSFGNLGNIVVHLRGNFLRLGLGRHDLPFYNDDDVELQKSFLSALCEVPIAVRKSPFKHDTIDAASGRAIQFRAEKEWPLARTTYTKYFLTPDLDFTPDEQQCQIHKRLSYPALTVPDDNSYHRFMTKPFDHDVEITGHIVAPVNVSVTPELTGGAPKDIDVFVTVRHWAKDGSEIFYTGSIGDPVFVSKGWQRVSLRKINKDHPNHREYRPWRDSFSPDVQPVIPGEIYGVDIEIWPTQLVLQSGEKLSFEVSGGDTQGVGIFSHESPERSPERFGDINHLHFGPRYSNYVVLPIIPTAPS
ncbi:X-Pro dipeptidyl-peptidase protein [Aureobasidium namibiae CBS 147.97]|uniref:X-Pro dipeptidyl-peptidase protein n=1 Tax=Aureobasidium namibiae CBS 147.97 TaxID=1043004 RepID=A0A074W5K5_9PEZI|nr:X-Pro dipeptidyl-peptidase protein [Aureobasidium namibiae CBS 147.97]KEQ68108.1 X-Pro dipeptidyl-peptidase protein [Aureobasidium namibiae CBS 147.97]